MSALRILAALSLLCCTHAFAGPWPQNQNPSVWSPTIQSQFSHLPLKAAEGISIPWSGHYWPDYQNGIAHRWQTGYSEDFTYTPPPLERLKKMILPEKNKLSAAEKWDILRGRYDYPTVKFERARTSKDQVKWAGLCHGWAMASIVFQEPQTFRGVNSDGVEIYLNSTDIKALVSLAISDQVLNDSLVIGTYCRRPGRSNPTNLDTPECYGINAGAFHTILSDTLGIQKQAMVVNISRDNQVWNYPVYGYETEVVAERMPSGRASLEAVKEVRVQTLMYRADIQETLTVDAVQNTSNQSLATERYLYWLELDSAGKIVGGSWETFWHPGFVWKNQNPIQTFSGNFEGLEKILSRN